MPITSATRIETVINASVAMLSAHSPRSPKPATTIDANTAVRTFPAPSAASTNTASTPGQPMNVKTLTSALTMCPSPSPIGVTKSVNTGALPWWAVIQLSTLVNAFCEPGTHPAGKPAAVPLAAAPAAIPTPASAMPGHGGRSATRQFSAPMLLRRGSASATIALRLERRASSRDAAAR